MEQIFCYGACNQVVPSINTQPFQSVLCSQFCATHQQTATDLSPSLDSSLTFSLFLTVTRSLPCLLLHYLWFAAKPFFWFFLIHLENLLFLSFAFSRRMKARSQLYCLLLCFLQPSFTPFQTQEISFKHEGHLYFCLLVAWLWHELIYTVTSGVMHF